MTDALKGNSGIFCTWKLAEGATAAVEYDTDLKKVEITSEDKDDSDLTFAEAALGDLKDFTLAITALQRTVTGSLWRFLWDNPGAEIDIVYGPSGNAAATEAKPHFAMRVKNGGKPTVGGEARKTKDRYSFDHELEVLDGPHLVTA